MNKLLLPFFIFLSHISYSQISEGQKFCEETKDGPYFPILEYNFNKKIFWYKTFYKETREGMKVIDGKTYYEFKQEWQDKNISTLYLREENGVVYQYEESLKKETIRYDPKYTEGYFWKSADRKDCYKIISYHGELRTPYCEYKNLLVIEANVSFGKFKFYYLKGHGYIGATKNDKLVSCLTPEHN